MSIPARRRIPDALAFAFAIWIFSSTAASGDPPIEQSPPIATVETTFDDLTAKHLMIPVPGDAAAAQ